MLVLLSLLTPLCRLYCTVYLMLGLQIYDPAFVFEHMVAGNAPGHACEYETSTMLHLFPDREYPVSVCNGLLKLNWLRRILLVWLMRTASKADLFIGPCTRSFCGRHRPKPP